MVGVLEVVTPVRQINQVGRKVLQEPLVALDLLDVNSLQRLKNEVRALLPSFLWFEKKLVARMLPIRNQAVLYLGWVRHEDPGQQVPALHRDVYIVGDGVLYAQDPLQ